MRRLVEDFISNWDHHRAVLRTRNLAAQEGDLRFRTGAQRSAASAHRGDRGEGRGTRANRVSRPYAAAAAMVSMLERMAAFHADLEAYGTSRAEVVETTARILHRTATGE